MDREGSNLSGSPEVSRRRKAAIGVAAVLGLWALLALVPPAPRPVHPYFAGLEGLQVIAHRGGADAAPESTLPLFRHADSLGADILELDLRRSADGALVVFHDRRVHRVTEDTGRVDRLTLARLQALDAGYRWSPDGGRTHPYRGKGLRIPSLGEFLAAFPGRRVLIELKSGHEDSAQRLCGELRSHGMQSLAIVASFRHRSLSAFREACPEVATSASAREVAVDWGLRALRLDGLVEPDFDAYHVPESAGPIDLVNPRFVERARRRGLPVQVWTVNRDEQMERLIETGVDGIMTDRPEDLIQLLRRRGLR